MSGHEHHHDDGEECHCHEHDHEHEHTSLEEAGGCAVGLQGTITGWNADSEARMAEALTTVGKWVVKESGVLLGHIKAAVVDENGKGLTLNLTDLDNGVEHHGSLEPMETVRFSFMTAVVDVDEHELRHRMFHAIDDTGLDYELDEHVECHCHDHDHDEECHCHGHHHDDDEECCHGHHHDDDEECCHGHHHDDDEECCHGHHHDNHLEGTISGWNADSEARITKALETVGKWIAEQSGTTCDCIATMKDDKGNELRLSLDSPGKSVARTGGVEATEKIEFVFCCNAEGVDPHELAHTTFHAFDDAALDYELGEHSYRHEHHHHDDGKAEKTEDKAPEKKSFLDRIRRNNRWHTAYQST